jgi:hypothetical protein
MIRLRSINSLFYKLRTARALAAVADDQQNSLLQVGHYGIRRPAKVSHKIAGEQEKVTKNNNLIFKLESSKCDFCTFPPIK